MNTPQFHQLPGWLVSEDPAGEKAGCGGPGQWLAWLHIVGGCEAGWPYFQIVHNLLEKYAFCAYGKCLGSITFSP